MAARNTTITCPIGEPTKITDGTVTAVRVVGNRDFWLCATAADTAPSDFLGAIPLMPYSIAAGNLTTAELFPGVTGPHYLWAWPTSGDTDVSISHA